MFQKKTYKEQLLCYHLLLILKPCCNYHCIPASLREHSEIWGKTTFYHFSKKCLFSVFLHIEAQLSLKNARLPPVVFLDSIAADVIYLSHTVIIWEKLLPISGHRP